MLTPIPLPPDVVTVAVFLRPEDVLRPAHDAPLLDRFAWVRHLNRLVTRRPVVLAGREPIRHPDFYDILDGLRRDLVIEIETGLEFDVGEWLERVAPERFDAARLAPTLRVRFDPRTMDAEATIERALLLQGAGFQVGLKAVLVPTHKAQALAAAAKGRRAGLDFRTEPFVGRLNGRLFGHYRYRAACLGYRGRAPGRYRALCRSSQLLVAPTAKIFGCRRHLLAGEDTIARLSEERPRLTPTFRPCAAFGRCDPRDVAVAVDGDRRSTRPAVEIVPRPRRRAAS